MHEIFLLFSWNPLECLSTTKDERHDSGVEDDPSDLNSELCPLLPGCNVSAGDLPTWPLVSPSVKLVVRTHMCAGSAWLRWELNQVSQFLCGSSLKWAQRGLSRRPGRQNEAAAVTFWQSDTATWKGWFLEASVPLHSVPALLLDQQSLGPPPIAWWGGSQSSSWLHRNSKSWRPPSRSHLQWAPSPTWLLEFSERLVCDLLSKPPTPPSRPSLPGLPPQLCETECL